MPVMLRAVLRRVRVNGHAADRVLDLMACVSASVRMMMVVIVALMLTGVGSMATTA
jgi:hypothetical protein